MGGLVCCAWLLLLIRTVSSLKASKEAMKATVFGHCFGSKCGAPSCHITSELLCLLPFLFFENTLERGYDNFLTLKSCYSFGFKYSYVQY